MKIEQPDWHPLVHNLNSQNSVRSCMKWFVDNIAGKEFYDPKDAVEMFSCTGEIWHERLQPDNDIYKSLLINKELIENDSFQKLAQDIADNKKLIDVRHFQDRAKKLLEKSK